MLRIRFHRLLVTVGLLTSLINLTSGRQIVRGLPDPTQTPEPISWAKIGPGIEYTQTPIATGDEKLHMLQIARIDPASVLFRVYYEPGKRQTIQDWAKAKPGALVIVNAGFFRGNGRPLGLVMLGHDVLNRASGRPGSGYFQVQDEIPTIGTLTTGVVESLKVAPTYAEAFEGYPLIVDKGKSVVDVAAYDADSKAWRTILAQDGAGRILIFVTTPTELKLPVITNWLCNSGLDIVTAMNLDGGSSSQMYVAVPTGYPPVAFAGPSLPVVLVVYPR